MAVLGAQKCKICRRQFKAGTTIGIMGHLRQGHKLTRQEAYDVQFRKSSDGKCLDCGKPTVFNKYRKSWGYHLYCSSSCRSRNSKLITTISKDKEFMSLVCSANGRMSKGTFSKSTLNGISKRRSEANKRGDGFGYKIHEGFGEKFKSSWELEFATLCNEHEINWSYEPKTFVYKVDDKTRRYTPDFFVNDQFVEIKPKPLINDIVLEKGREVMNATGKKWVVISRPQFSEFFSRKVG